MAATIVEELRNLNRPEITDQDHDCTAAEVTAAVCNLLSEIVLKDDTEGEKLVEWETTIREIRCKILGEHTWQYNYCVCCNQVKYPEKWIV